MLRLFKDPEDFEDNEDYLDSEDEIYNESWNDVKNGVNSHSKKLYFHISTKTDLDDKTLDPRIPSYLLDDYVPHPDYPEDNKTPRICVSPSIEGCLRAIMNGNSLLQLNGMSFAVYTPRKPFDKLKHKTNKEIIKEKLVYDANLTGEAWILEPCKLRLYGSIRVNKVTKWKPRESVNKGIKVGTFNIDWEWIVKPQAMGWAVYDDSDEADMDNVWKESATMEHENKELDSKLKIATLSDTFNIDDVELEEDDLLNEGFFAVGFGNLRKTIADSLGDKFKVSNVQNPTGKEEKFTIKPLNGTDDVVNVVSTGNAVKAYGYKNGERVSIFNNAVLSAAANKIMDAIEEIFGDFKPVVESYTRFDVGGFSRWGKDSFFNEADEPEAVMNDDPEPAPSDSSASEDDTTTPPDMDDTSIEDTADDDNTASTLNIDVEFGSDKSDIQNDYNEKDVEYLNKLIASESSAVSEYLNGAKDTKDPHLQKLYSDIGDEERFHLEQLLYGKSQLTGEKYEPRDPEVKREYEELIAGGMDEDTAVSVAIDKRTIDKDLPDVDELATDAEMTEYAINNIRMLENIIYEYIKNADTSSSSIINESFFMEYIDKDPQEKPDSLIRIAWNMFKQMLNLITKMKVVANNWYKKDFAASKRKKEWIARNGIIGLFKNGIYLYVYNDKEPGKSCLPLIYQFTDMLDAALHAILNAHKIKNVPQRLSFNNKTWTTPNYNSSQQALSAINNIHLEKTKIVVTDVNKDAIEKMFFGYNEQKVSVGGEMVSHNMYNDFRQAQEWLEYCLDNTIKVVLSSNDMTSVYNTNQADFRRIVSEVQTIEKCYSKILSAIVSDINQFIKVNNNLRAMTEERDVNDAAAMAKKKEQSHS